MRYSLYIALFASCFAAGCDRMSSAPDKEAVHDTIGANLLRVDSNGKAMTAIDTAVVPLSNTPTPVIDTIPGSIITGNTQPEAVVSFAESLVGTPYQYGSTDPKVGFDCSGFITYVFTHFNIKVPRSSIDFTREGQEVQLSDAKRGDIILFTGTNNLERHVGHMGIVVGNLNGDIRFIHSSSGKAHGVVVTPLDEYYMGRFMKVIRIFPSLSLNKQG